MAIGRRDVEIILRARDEASRVFPGIERGLDSLKTKFGRGSVFQESFELLKGAGAVAGVALAANMLKNVAAEAEQVVTKFRMGETSARDVSFELAKSVPILGSLVSSGQSFVEILTGAGAKARLAAKEFEAFAKASDARRKRIAELQSQTSNRGAPSELQSLQDEFFELQNQLIFHGGSADYELRKQADLVKQRIEQIQDEMANEAKWKEAEDKYKKRWDAMKKAGLTGVKGIDDARFQLRSVISKFQTTSFAAVGERMLDRLGITGVINRGKEIGKTIFGGAPSSRGGASDGIQALEGRFLTRAGGMDTITPVRDTATSTKQTASNTAELIAKVGETNQKLDKLSQSRPVVVVRI